MPSLLRREYAGSLFPPIPHRPIVAWHPQHLPAFSPPNRATWLLPCEIGVDEAEGFDSRRLPLHVKSGETRNVRSVQS